MGQTPEEGDVLAGMLFETFGPASSLTGPVYPAGPHCNEAGFPTSVSTSSSR